MTDMKPDIGRTQECINSWQLMLGCLNVRVQPSKIGFADQSFFAKPLRPFKSSMTTRMNRLIG
jgi:hypothetical protein